MTLLSFTVSIVLKFEFKGDNVDSLYLNCIKQDVASRNCESC